MATKMSLIVTFISYFWVRHSFALDTLHQGDTLGSSEYLSSAKGNFILGFSNLEDSDQIFNGSSRIYLGIWFSNGNEMIWLANRDNPLLKPSGNLTIDSTGRLIIKRERGNPIELYSGGTVASNASAMLQDDGNFVLREVFANGSTGKILWQSFDYPTNILLPGMKLGVNHKTGRNWSLTSWLADNSPASGPFTLQWDPRGRRLEIWQRGKLIWTSRMRTIDNSTSMDSIDFSYYFNYSNVSNVEEDYFTYSLVDDFDYLYFRGQNRSFWKLDDRGHIIRLDGMFLSDAELCYGYNTDYGCEKREYPKCRTKGDKF